jgi:hypothetical protein
MDNIPSLVWKGLGIIQIIGSTLTWIPKNRKATAGFFIVFMLSFTIYHLLQNTYDVAGLYL